MYLFAQPTIQHQSFRIIVWALPISLLYDVFWLIVSGGIGDSDDIESAGLESGIRNFSYYMSFISMLSRFVIIGVFAKASVEFNKTFTN